VRVVLFPGLSIRDGDAAAETNAQVTQRHAFLPSLRDLPGAVLRAVANALAEGPDSKVRARQVLGMHVGRHM